LAIATDGSTRLYKDEIDVGRFDTFRAETLPTVEFSRAGKWVAIDTSQDRQIVCEIVRQHWAEDTNTDL